MFHIALLVNPVAGLGGPAAMKGSDAADVLVRAKALGLQSKIPEKIRTILDALHPYSDQLCFSVAGGAMGEDYFSDFPDFSYRVMHSPNEQTSAEDTRDSVHSLLPLKPDLLLFAGGDGTARDVCAAIRQAGNASQVCLGIPSGVKMHSGVFAITPKAVVSVIESMMQRKLVAAVDAEVRDIDEASFREGRVVTQHYGELLVPDDQLLVQSVKCSGLPDDEMALGEIAAFIEEESEDDCLYLLGSGGTLLHVKNVLGLDQATLLGVDAWCNGEQVGTDLNEREVFDLVQQYQNTKLFISVIGGQGIVLGRGNQQLSPRVLSLIGVEHIQLLGTQERLLELNGKALCVDSGDDEVDRAFSGFQKVLCGYEDYVLYEVRYVA